MTADRAPATAREAEAVIERLHEQLRELAHFGDRPGYAARMHVHVNKLAALLSPPAAAQEHLDRIAKFLNLERERGSYWLPAEPGPIECGSIAEAVEQFAHLADNEQRRAAAAAQEIERLRAALKGLMPYRAHLRGCEVDMTEFCTCGLRERVDTARRALTLEARNGQ